MWRINGCSFCVQRFNFKPVPSKTSATIVAKNKSKDIRAMFKKIARKNVEQEPEAENDNVHSAVLID